MNKQTVGLAGAFFVAVCIGSTCVAQETQPSAQSSGPQDTQLPAQAALVQEVQPSTHGTKSQNSLPLGTLRVTSSPLKDSFIIEANQAPMESVLQAIAKQANRKIVISDEARQKLTKIKVFSNSLKETTADEAFERFAKNSFSWGKLGDDTYLLVPRLASPVEKAVKQAGVIEQGGTYKLVPSVETEVKKPELHQPSMPSSKGSPFRLLSGAKKAA
ncbi:hypothetical protein EON83_26735 [bacterium]|nr:MAG: hypothetical protein EON83_26735 [bacterium]